MDPSSRAVARRSLRELPAWLQLVVAAVVAGYCAAVCAATAATRVHAGQLRLFLLVAGCSTAAVELGRQIGEPAGGVPNVDAIWDLPAAVLLPPLYALLAPVPRVIADQARGTRGLVHRRAYTSAAAGLAQAAASLAFHAAVPELGPGAGAGTGGRAMLWTMLAAGCGLLRFAISNGLALAAVKDPPPGGRPAAGTGGIEGLHGSAARLCLGTLSAFAAVHSTLALLYAVPLAVSVQHSLRHAQLVSETRVDGKTGLLNDKTWRREAAREIARAARAGTPLAVGIMDLDHFKTVNDTYGHLAGDAVLSVVAAATTALLREYDVIGRVGGEEFAFLLPGTPPAEAAEIAERLRAKIPLLTFPGAGTGGPVPARVTVSIGVAAASRPGWDLDRYYSLADQALYAAKQNGRNAVWAVTADQAADLKPSPGGAARRSEGLDGDS